MVHLQRLRGYLCKFRQNIQSFFSVNIHIPNFVGTQLTSSKRRQFTAKTLGKVLKSDLLRERSISVVENTLQGKELT